MAAFERKNNVSARAHFDRFLLQYPIASLAVYVILFSAAVYLFFKTIGLALMDESSAAAVVFSSAATGVQDISCATVQDRMQQKIWPDPNNGRVFARKLITNPSFTISVHNETYDPVRWHTLFNEGKYYEEQVFARFVKILSANQPASKNSVVVDVGANIGIYTLLSATLGYPVIAFEINPANLIRLCESLQLNNHVSRVTIFQNGVSDTDGTPLQVLVPKNPGQAFMIEMSDTSGLEKLRLSAQEGLGMANDSSTVTTHHAFTTTVTLDAFVKHLSTEKIAILKLDVEGKEPQIIEGAKELLQSGRVDNVLTEFRRLGRDTIQQAIATLLAAGYTLVDDWTNGPDHPPKRMSRQESVDHLTELAEKFKGNGRNFDFWFQRA